MAELNAAAPKITDHLCDPCAAHFARSGRTSTRWASTTASSPASSAASTTTRGRRSSSTVPGREGQQQALGGGGRYDGLVELLGGRPTPGIGFGLGLDRIVLALRPRRGRRRGPATEAAPVAVVVGADPAAHGDPAPGGDRAARGGHCRPADLGRAKLGRQLESAAKDHAHFVVIIGDELADGNVQLKDLEAGSQQLVAARRPGPQARPAATGPTATAAAGACSDAGRPAARSSGEPERLRYGGHDAPQTRASPRRTGRHTAARCEPPTRARRSDSRAGSTAAATTAS